MQYQAAYCFCKGRMTGNEPHRKSRTFKSQINALSLKIKCHVSVLKYLHLEVKGD